MRFVTLLASIVCVLGAGCSALVDSTLSGRPHPDAGTDVGPNDAGHDAGPMPDMGPPSPCAGQPDGIHCTMPGLAEPFVCVHNLCQLSRCGDGVVDMRVGSMHVAEECDDGNSISGDGCEMNCTFSCHANTDCDDMHTCDGTETCAAATATGRRCAAGTNLTDGTTCTVMTTGGPVTASCHMGVCRSGMCGDGTLDPGEQCDDHNLIDGDGCEHDCTFTCVMDTDCHDPNACDVAPTCTVATHVCHLSTTPVSCDDMDMCTTDTCDMTNGCVNTSRLVDHDGDGFFMPLAGCGGDDCDDNNPNAYPGAPEPCGSTMDLNCDSMIGTPPTWYVDCDHDSYAPLGGASMSSCTEPAPPTSCSNGRWTTRMPTSATHDCLDTNANAHPSQMSYFPTNVTGLAPTYDYNCDGIQEREFTTGQPLFSVGCAFRGSICEGSAWYNVTSTPACGAPTTLSHCAFVLSGTPLTAHCNRIETTNSTTECH
jgi:cysteine-rich repeat protein